MRRAGGMRVVKVASGFVIPGVSHGVLLRANYLSASISVPMSRKYLYSWYFMEGAIPLFGKVGFYISVCLQIYGINKDV